MCRFVNENRFQFGKVFAIPTASQRVRAPIEIETDCSGDDPKGERRCRGS